MKENLPLNAYFKKLEKELYQLLNSTKICFFKNDCCNKVIDAHSITKSSLKKIADLYNQLYVSKIESTEALADLKENLIFSPKRESISKISTFKGLCGFHDKEIFQEIEDIDIIPSEMQNLKFFFRTVAYNYYSKMPGVKILDAFKNAILPIEYIRPEFTAKLLSAYEPLQYVKKEIYGELEILKNAIVKQQSLDLNYIFIRIDSIPEIMCCETIAPSHDLNGTFLFPKIIIDDDDATHYFNINISSDSQGGYIHIGWHRRFEVANHFVLSFYKHNYDLNKLVAYIFYKLSNYGYSINWWDTQLDVLKKKLIYYYSVHFSPKDSEGEITKEISKDSNKYVNWRIINIKTNFELIKTSA